MKSKYVGAASALALGLAICGGAAAQTATNLGKGGSADATAVSIPGGDNNSLGDNNDNSNQGNTNTQLNSNAVLSNNALGSDNTRLDDSQNDNSNQHNDYSDNSNQDRSINVGVKANVTEQTLSSNVSGLSFNGGDIQAGLGASDNRGVSSGALSYSGGAYQGWSGVQTASTNTGVASNNLAATAVSANANVNFGGGAGGSQ